MCLRVFLCIFVCPRDKYSGKFKLRFNFCLQFLPENKAVHFQLLSEVLEGWKEVPRLKGAFYIVGS